MLIVFASTLAGAGFGAVGGALIGFMSEGPSDMPGFGLLAGGIAGAMVGGLTGAVVGGKVVAP